MRYSCVVIARQAKQEHKPRPQLSAALASLPLLKYKSSAHKIKYRTTTKHHLQNSSSSSSNTSTTKVHHITMSHYTATITKQSKNQSIGIGLKETDAGLTISSITSEGPLGQTCLKPGMKLLTINNIEVSGLSTKEAVQIMKDAEGKLALSAVDFVPANITFQVNVSRGRADNGQINERVLATMKRDINNATPTLFMEAGVPSNTFSNIYTLIESELLPHAMALRSHETTYDREMQSYTGKQMVKGGLVGFGTESNHEKKVFQMVAQGAQLQRNVDLKAMQVKDKANAMLAKYNIMATVALESRRLMKYSSKQKQANTALDVVGIQFHPIPF